jgi:hypothetical protein
MLPEPFVNLLRQEAVMKPLTLDRPPTAPTLPGENAGPPPPGAARAEAVIEGVGIIIFLALLIGTVIILVRKKR